MGEKWEGKMEMWRGLDCVVLSTSRGVEEAETEQVWKLRVHFCRSRLGRLSMVLLPLWSCGVEAVR